MSKDGISVEVKKKANERLEDILDVIKIELDQINETSPIAHDVEIAQTLAYLTDSFDTIYRNIRTWEDN